MSDERFDKARNIDLPMGDPHPCDMTPAERDNMFRAWRQQENEERATNTRNVEPRISFDLTPQQIKQLLDFSFGGNTDPEEAMPATIGYLPEHEDGPGWYVWGTEYPEEGSLPLVTYKGTLPAFARSSTANVERIAAEVDAEVRAELALADKIKAARKARRRPPYTSSECGSDAWAFSAAEIDTILCALRGPDEDALSATAQPTIAQLPRTCSCGAQAGQYHATGCGYQGVFNG